MKTLTVTLPTREFRLGLASLVLAAMCTSPAMASDQIPGKSQEHPIAITGAMIHPVSSAPILGGTVVFEHGVITALGTDVAIPPDAEIIRAEGRHVYPGLISADTHIGLLEIEAVRATDYRQETGRINPNVRAETAFNPESEMIPVTRANGIMIAVVAPSGSLIRGMSAAMLMDGWTWEEMTLKAPLALNIDWPSMATPAASASPESARRMMSERDSALRELTEAVEDARAYRAARLAGAPAGVPAHETDSRWEAMIPVLEGTVPVVVWADEVREIQAAVRWADEEGLRLIIGGGLDAWRAADLLKARNIPVLVGGVYRLPPRRFSSYDEPFSVPMKLYEAGVRFAVTTGEGFYQERNLPYQAATAAAYGLPPEEALRSITLSPAEILGIADRVGSLETGKDATLIVTDGDPLEIPTHVERAFIQGRAVDLSSRHTLLRDKYRERYSRMRGQSLPGIDDQK
jgi:imidazolonepropionase-like amidohydrolase